MDVYRNRWSLVALALLIMTTMIIPRAQAQTEGLIMEGDQTNGCVTATSQRQVYLISFHDHKPDYWKIVISVYEGYNYQYMSEGATCYLTLDMFRPFFWSISRGAKTTLDDFWGLPAGTSQGVATAGQKLKIVFAPGQYNQFALQYNSSMPAPRDYSWRPLLDRHGGRNVYVQPKYALVGYGEVVDMRKYPSSTQTEHNVTFDHLFVLQAGYTGPGIEIIDGYYRKVPVSQAQNAACALRQVARFQTGHDPVNVTGIDLSLCPPT